MWYNSFNLSSSHNFVKSAKQMWYILTIIYEESNEVKHNKLILLRYKYKYELFLRKKDRIIKDNKIQNDKKKYYKLRD